MADPSTNPSALLSSVRVQVVQQNPGDILIVKDVTGKQAFDALRAINLPVTAIELARLTFGIPQVVSGQLTKVSVTPSQHSAYRAPFDLTYTRYSITALNNLVVPAEGFASVSAFLVWLRAAGYQVLDADIDLIKSTRRADGSVSIFPAKNSWLFSPEGSYDTSSMPKIENVLPVLVTDDFDTTPMLHMAIAVGELNGFEVVPPLVLGDEIANDTLNGFSAVGGN